MHHEIRDEPPSFLSFALEFRFMRKIIITAALTGGQQTKDRNPNLPEQPDEIAEAAHDCFNEGAAIVHLHARDINGVPTGDLAVYSDIHARIRERCNIVIQDSTGGGANLNLEQKAECLKAHPELASLNMGSMLRTIGKHSGSVFINSQSDIEYFARQMLERDIKPEMEVYHHGMLKEVHNLIQKKLIKKPYYINFVMGMAYQGAVDGTADNLVTLKTLLPEDSIFNVTGIGATQLPMTTLSMLSGGMVRVGMEDNIYYKKGVPVESNAQLVARSVRLARELGFEIATPDDAREILELHANQ